MKRKWRVAIALPVAVVALELLLRLFGYGRLPEGMSPDGTPLPDHAYDARNRYADAVLNAATDNVLVIGDAWAFGLGCTRDETFPALFEVELQQKRPQLRVVNAAAPDDSSVETAKALPEAIALNKPDALVVMTGLADGVPADWTGDFFARKPFEAGGRPVGSRWTYLFDNLRLSRRVHGGRWDPEAKEGYVARYRSVAETQNALLAIGRAAGDHGLPVVWITYPVWEGGGLFHPRFPIYARRNELIRVTALTYGHTLVDLEKTWSTGEARGLMLSWMPWPHPSPKGHARIAQAVGAELRRIFHIEE